MPQDVPSPDRPLIYSVDDDPQNLDLVSRVLRDKHEVVSFQAPEKALQRLGEKPPDLLITDYMMPGLDGLELVRRVRALGISCPVLMVTAYVDVDAVLTAEAQVAGVRVLGKPWRTQELRTQVDLALGLHRLSKMRASKP